MVELVTAPTTSFFSGEVSKKTGAPAAGIRGSPRAAPSGSSILSPTSFCLGFPSASMRATISWPR
jgi:hypothetical protein